MNESPAEGPSSVAAFAEAAREGGATVHRVSPVAVTATLEDIATAPAVGSPISFEGITLPDRLETEPDRETVRTARSGVTEAVLGVVDHGAVAVLTTAAGEGAASTYPDRHVAVVRESDFVADLPAALDALGDHLGRGGDAVLIAGPSATADMGETVRGVHGPADLHLVVVTDG